MGKKAGLWINRSKLDAEVLIPQLTNWFSANGWECIVDWDQNKHERVEFIISLGGDGTVLESAREAAPYEIPVLGVNYGKLGFLCEVEKNDLFTALKKVLAEKYVVEERLMLTSCLVRKDEMLEFTVLNDVVFLRENRDALVTLQIKLSNEPIASPPSDGLIIATSTGSTAYSLSAGGPVVSPEVQAILITPLAAHALSSRPMVVSHNEKIDVILTSGHECHVTFDGKHSIQMYPGETVRITTSPLKARLIRLGGRPFARIVREKLRDRWHE